MSTMTIRIASSSALLLVLCILSLAGVRGFHLETTYIHQKTALLTPGSSFRPHHADQEQQGSGLSSKRSSSTSSNRHRLRHQFALYASSSSYVNGKANDDYDEIADVLVIGSGPAARAIASLLSANNNKNKLNVILADKNVHRTWPPNYGVWQDEWQAVVDRYSALGVNLQGGRVGKAIDYEWSVTDCYFGGSFDIPTETRMRLDRPYYRVDRDAVRDSLTPPENGDDSGRKMAASSSSSSYKILRANHKSRATSVNVYEPAGSLVHDSTGTTVQLETVDNKLVTVRSKLVIDCTGHETDLVLRESRDVTSNSPGFQIAYGCLVDIDEAKSKDLAKVGPYAKEAMTLFDYRTDHYDDSDDATRGKVAAAPTFMYGTFCAAETCFSNTALLLGP
jgi:Lycopene cyclase protein